MGKIERICAEAMSTASAIIVALVLFCGTDSALADSDQWRLCDSKPNACCCCYGNGFTNCKMKYSDDCRQSGGNMLLPYDPEAAKAGKTRCPRCWD